MRRSARQLRGSDLRATSASRLSACWTLSPWERVGRGGPCNAILPWKLWGPRVRVVERNTLTGLRLGF
jgi:hypothetical protein